MRGVYALVVKVPRRIKMTVGALGTLSFERGEWVYVGSAMGSGSTTIERRLERHFRAEKKLHWHIDYLLRSGAEATSAVFAESDTPMECSLAQALRRDGRFQQGPTGFGASDCRMHCKTHIFRYEGTDSSHPAIQEVFRGLGLRPIVMER